MVNPLILLHAFLAEIGLFAFLWIVVELLNPTESRIQRAQIAAVVGVCGLYLASLASFSSSSPGMRPSSTTIRPSTITVSTSCWLAM